MSDVGLASSPWLDLGRTYPNAAAATAPACASALSEESRHLVGVGSQRREESYMSEIYSGMPAASLPGVTWQKSRRSNSMGNCVEMAKLPGGAFAVRNSRYPDGPALVYTRAEIEALILGVKDGDFDNLLQ